MGASLLPSTGQDPDSVSATKIFLMENPNSTFSTRKSNLRPFAQQWLLRPLDQLDSLIFIEYGKYFALMYINYTINKLSLVCGLNIGGIFG